MRNYLIVFTISPVQSFLAQARKTVDLYSGSRLLSELIGNAMKFISISNNSIRFMFPDKDSESKPNRFVAQLTTDSVESIRKLMSEVEESVKEDYFWIATKVFTSRFNGQTKPNGFDEQIKNFLVINWAALEIFEGNYNESYLKLESLLGASKNTRVFEQHPETGRKCSLCGERNVLFHNRIESKTVQKDARDVKGNELNTGEGLCAVCFVKRFKSKESFPSTAKVATFNAIKKIGNSNQLLLDYQKMFDSGDFDAQLYYKDNLNEKYFKKQGLEKYTSSIESITNALNKLYKIEKVKFPKYYALMMFDGDSMGKWLTGEYLKKGVNLEEHHVNLTKVLANFAKEVESYLKDPLGDTIYAGGEDFLGIINLSHLYEVMQTLRTKFDQLVAEPINLNCNPEKNVRLSFSAGIVITHYKMPLGEALNKVRVAEKKAKNHSIEKNNFCISVIKHSGEMVEFLGTWGSREHPGIVSSLKTVHQMLEEEQFSLSSFRNLIQALQTFPEPDSSNPFDQEIIAETKRIIARGCAITQLPDESKKEFSDRKGTARDTMVNALEIITKYNRNSQENLISTLKVIDFIIRKLNGEE